MLLKIHVNTMLENINDTNSLIQIFKENQIE